MTAENTSGEATAADGTRLAYTLHGGTAASRIVLIHSLAMDRSFWAPAAAALSDRHQVLVYDCRGHGQSAKPAGPYSTDLFADDLAAVLEAVGWESAIVGGSSMGGCVALAFAIRHPARTQALALIDTTSFYGENAPAEWAGRAGKAKSEGLASLLPFQRTRWFSDAFRAERPEIVAATEGVFLANAIEPYVETCRMLGAFDGRGGLAGIKVPVAILVGEEDYATPPAMAGAMQAGIPHASLEVLRGVRHFTPLEVPERIAAEIDSLALRVAAPAGRGPEPGAAAWPAPPRSP